ncbi:MAG: hypothetical protein ACK562_15355 [Acidobacteriota bacterium]
MMIKQCPACQVIIDRPAKFCRQCGTMLPVVTEPKPSVATRGTTPPRARVSTSQTTRGGRPPGPLTGSPSAGNSARTGRNGGDLSTGRMLGLIVLVLILLGFGVYLIIIVFLGSQRLTEKAPTPSFIEKQPTPVQQKILSKEKINARCDEIMKKLTNNDHTTASEQFLGSLGRLVYPNATSEIAYQKLEIYFLKLTTTDSLDQVIKYYRPQFKSQPLNPERGARPEETIFSQFEDVDTCVKISKESKRDGTINIIVTGDRSNSRAASPK